MKYVSEIECDMCGTLIGESILSRGEREDNFCYEGGACSKGGRPVCDSCGRCEECGQYFCDECGGIEDGLYADCRQALNEEEETAEAV
jgi:hypothetical protein